MQGRAQHARQARNWAASTPLPRDDKPHLSVTPAGNVSFSGRRDVCHYRVGRLGIAGLKSRFRLAQGMLWLNDRKQCRRRT